MAKKKKKNGPPKRRKPGATVMRNTRGDQLIQELDDQIGPMAAGMPPEFAKLVEKAKMHAARGDTDLIEEMLFALGQAGEAPAGSEEDWEAEFPLTDVNATRAFLELQADENIVKMHEAVQTVLEVDPDAIEILIGLGLNAPKVAERIQWFQRASDAARRKDPDDVTNFMPEYRMRMVNALMEDGRISDAVEILLPSLKEDSGDEIGARFAAADLLLRLGWEDELQEVLGAYPDDEVGPLAFAAALLAFRKEGASDRANQLLIHAENEFPGVSQYLCGMAPMPSLQEDDEEGFAWGPDDSEIAGYLLPGVRDTEGAVAWIRETLADGLLPPALLDDPSDLPDGVMPWDDLSVDLLSESLDARQSEDEWQLVIQKVDLPGAIYAAAILGGQRLRYARSFDEQPKASELRECFLRSVSDPIDGRACRPATLLVPTKTIHRMLVKHCGTIDVGCEQHAVSPSQKELLGHQLRILFRSGDADDESAPTSASIQSTIDDVPVCDETWLMGAFNPPLFIHDGPTPRRGWIVLIADAENGFLLKADVLDTQPSKQDLLDIMLKAMKQPMMGDPRRPSRVIIAPETKPDLDWLSSEVSELEWKAGDETLSDYFTNILVEMLLNSGPTETALRNVDGVDDDQLAELYETAARFYRVKPWQMVAGDRLFDITCDEWENITWTGCVMGQLGQELGLGLYDDPADARAVVEENASDLSRFNSLVIHFDEAHEAIPADVWNIERCGWEVASPDALPFIARVTGGRDLLPPSAEDLRVLQAAMQHTPRFLDHPEDEPLHVPYGKSVITFEWVNFE